MGCVGLLKDVRYIGAPMVRASEYAFRRLVRKYGVGLTYLPMIEADKLARAKHSKEELFRLGFDPREDEQEGLVAQIAAGSHVQEGELVVAAKMIEENSAISAIDLNLGCPQACAKSRRFGAFSSDVHAVKVVRILSSKLSIPVFCKIRVLESADETVAFARRLEAAGCQMLVIHGRRRELKHDGAVDLKQIKQVARALKIPVVANGDINSAADAKIVMEECGVPAVMSATGLLRNHRCFAEASGNIHPFELAFEYLDSAIQYPPHDRRCLQNHMKYILRATLRSVEISKNGLDQEGRHVTKWWSVLCQNYMTSAWQYMCVLRMICEDFQVDPGKFCSYRPLEDYGIPILHTLKDVKRGGRREEILCQPNQSSVVKTIRFGEAA